MAFDSIRALNSLERTLRLWPGLSALQALIEKGEAFNDNPRRTPWIGLHCGPEDSEPHLIGGRWRIQGELQVYLQTASRQSGEAAQGAVRELARQVKLAIQANPELVDEHGSATKFVSGISEQPGYPLDAVDGAYFRTIVMTIKLEARA